jgi:acetylglutamate/LysW-gamma-L-alpha-aminoadipate kinase
MKADTLILTTDVDALYVKGKPIPRLKLDEAKKILKDIGPGMITKIYASTEALTMGVKKVCICSGRGESPLIKALEGIAGTTIER